MGLVKDLADTAVDLSHVCSTYVKREVQQQFMFMKSETMHLIYWGIMMFTSAICLLAGVGFLLAGALILLASLIGYGFSALIVGAVILWLGITMFLIFKSQCKR